MITWFKKQNPRQKQHRNPHHHHHLHKIFLCKRFTHSDPTFPVLPISAWWQHEYPSFYHSLQQIQLYQQRVHEAGQSNYCDLQQHKFASKSILMCITLYKVTIAKDFNCCLALRWGLLCTSRQETGVLNSMLSKWTLL